MCLTLENVLIEITLVNLDISTNWITGIQMNFKIIFDMQ